MTANVHRKGTKRDLKVVGRDRNIKARENALQERWPFPDQTGKEYLCFNIRTSSKRKESVEKGEVSLKLYLKIHYLVAHLYIPIWWKNASYIAGSVTTEILSTFALVLIRT